MTLAVLRSTGQIFCRLSLNLGSPHVFPIIRLEHERIFSMGMVLIKFSLRKITVYRKSARTWPTNLVLIISAIRD